MVVCVFDLSCMTWTIIIVELRKGGFAVDILPICVDRKVEPVLLAHPGRMHGRTNGLCSVYCDGISSAEW
jgi:hypothetical protein